MTNRRNGLLALGAILAVAELVVLLAVRPVPGAIMLVCGVIVAVCAMAGYAGLFNAARGKKIDDSGR